MKTVVKIVWKEKYSYFCCSGYAPIEESTVTVTTDSVRFKRIGKMDGYMGYECPVSEVKETWEAKIKNPDFGQTFKELAGIADDVVNNNTEIYHVCDGPEQTLVVYYDDGRKKRIQEYSFLLDPGAVKALLQDYLPERMVQAMFGDLEEEESEDGTIS